MVHPLVADALHHAMLLCGWKRVLVMAPTLKTHIEYRHPVFGTWVPPVP